MKKIPFLRLLKAPSVATVEKHDNQPSSVIAQDLYLLSSAL